MKKTVLITGTSSGFGAAAANFFVNHGWNVIATMRDISKAGDLQNSKDVLIEKLDVQDNTTIDSTIATGIEHFGKIDVVVNNAGYGLFGVFESASRDAIQQQFEVNVFGAMDVVRAILPHFRANRSGTIINISSGAGVIGFPMASIYSSSKFALEGWSEGLRYELASLGIKVKIIEPGGAGATKFMQRVGGEAGRLQYIEDYLPFLEHTGAMYGGMQGNSDPDAVDKVVDAIYTAATDNTDQLRYTPTNDIKPILDARRSTSEAEYHTFTRSIFEQKKEESSAN
ncbi:SDR family oxidoreductase [Chitinophaga polysaccharea]|uniref:SDR family oxidoreductase n=1 Tax=Chitinophaga polysaccharea TaxID=1293035 RepID=UPI00115838B0|nr:SDR family oxidoreductase [Chitinophaga polysaccharea]